MIVQILLALSMLRSIDAVEPLEASSIAARIVGRPELAPEIAAICKVESRPCSRVGVHRGHARRVRGDVFFRAAEERGWVDPEGCVHHRDRTGERWGIRGSHGNAAAYAVRHLGRCVGPEALDLPLLSAIATAHRLEELRRRYGRRTTKARAHAWRHGVFCNKPGHEEEHPS